MIEILGVQIGMTWLGLAALAVGAIVIGLVGQFVGEVHTKYEWVPDVIAAFVGGFLASEALGSLSTWGPEWEGLFIGPALIGAVLVTLAVDAAVRWGTGVSFRGHAHPA